MKPLVILLIAALLSGCASLRAAAPPDPLADTVETSRGEWEAIVSRLCGPEGSTDDTDVGPTCEREIMCRGPIAHIADDDPGLALFADSDGTLADRKVALAIERANSCDDPPDSFDALLAWAEAQDRWGWGVELARLCPLFTTFTVPGRQYDCARAENGVWTVIEVDP